MVHGLATITQTQHDERRPEVKKSNQPRLRELLRQHPDGLAVLEMSERLELPTNSVLASLKCMPDAYIDRWFTAGRKKYYSAVWCVVVPPENCPKPKR